MTTPATARFWTKVRKTRRCWFWTGAINAQGYGNFYLGKFDGKKKYVGAHVFAWTEENGPVPDGLVLDHTCRARNCVRPSHLRVTTHGENIRAGTGWAGRNAQKTHCIHGHEFTPENTKIAKNGSRHCKACAKITRAKYPSYKNNIPWAEKTHCKNGHERTPENTYIYPNGNRACRPCIRAWDRARRARKGQ